MARTRERNRIPRAEQLSRQIESLNRGFRRISSPSNPADLAGQAIPLLRRLFSNVKFDILHMRQDAAAWQLLSDGKAHGLDQMKELVRRKKPSPFSLQTTSIGVCWTSHMADNSVVGVALRAPSKKMKLAEVDAILLRLFAHFFETAYQALLHRRNEKTLVFSLNHRLLQLNSLIDTGIEISKLDQSASPHHMALERAASLTNASRGVLQVMTGDKIKEEIYFPEKTEKPTSSTERLRISTGFTFANDTYFFELFEKESRSGLVPFEDTDQVLLDALARQVHASLENRYLLEKALENQKFEQDMAVAASIQKRIIPATLPAIKGYDIAGINIPSKSVGGDYYDCVRLADGSYALIIADVTGKGIPAALLVSSLHAYLSAYLEGNLLLSDLAERLNKVIFRASTDDKFITALIAVLSPETGELNLVNAGHNPAYILKTDGTVKEIAAGGLPLGMLDMDLPFQSESVTIEKGERLLLYTDGITEACDEAEEMYDNHRPLNQFFAAHKPDQAELFIADLITDIRKFTGSAPQSDDITALYLHRCS